jgi:hypothetical protein
MRRGNKASFNTLLSLTLIVISEGNLCCHSFAVFVPAYNLYSTVVTRDDHKAAVTKCLLARNIQVDYI